MAVTCNWVRRDTFRKHKIAMAKFTYAALDTTITWDTGLNKVYSYDTSPPSVAGKYVTDIVEAAGVLTITVTNPAAGAYLFVTAEGI